MELIKIIRYLEEKSISEDWVKSRDLIIYERERILSSLSKGRHAYGFTSLLGPLDSLSASADQQNILLSAHNIGFPKQVDPKLMKTILAVKINSLSHGGSGISISAYDHLLCSLRKTEDSLQNAKIDFEASYSSGDVVPAAHFVNIIYGNNYRWEPGDLIALLNGHFISSAVGLYAVIKSISSIFESLFLISPFLVVPSRSTNILGDFFESEMIPRKKWDEPPQKSVFERDSAQVLELVDYTFINLFTEIENDLNKINGNPLFLVSGDQVQSQSQSSFLNFRFSNSFRELNELIKIISGMIQLATDIASESKQQNPSNSIEQKIRFVQHPKVSHAYQLRLASIQSLSIFTGKMSGGVENLWDLSLSNSLNTLKILEILEKQNYLLGEVVEDEKKNTSEIKDKYIDYLIKNIKK